MNELLAAIEAIIRRIVSEEIGKLPLQASAPTPPPPLDSAVFTSLMERFLNARTQQFHLAVREACVDQGWFDDAVRAEAASLIDYTPVPTNLEDTVIDSGRISDYIESKVNDILADTEFVTRVR